MNRRGLFSFMIGAPLAAIAAVSAKAGVWQTMLDSGMFASFPGFRYARKLESLPDNEYISQDIFDVANEIRVHLSPMPDGFYVNQDVKTGSIIVHSDKLGFAVTTNTIKDGNYLEVARRSFEHLLKVVENMVYTENAVKAT